MIYKKIARRYLFASLLALCIGLLPSRIMSGEAATIITTPIINYAEAAAPATPTHLTIPNAHVDTNIIDVGITPKGNLDVPGNYTEVGWYKFGTRPGEIGSAVLDGHVDNGGSIPGPFKHLRDLKNGDHIYVTVSDGRVLNYKVVASNAYALKDFPAQEVFNQTGDRYLKLITCHGTFVPAIHTYDQRLIVSAVLDM